MGFKRQQIRFSSQLKIVASLMLLLTGIEIFNASTGRALNQLGLIPGGPIEGIFIAPFLHGSMMHFAANFIPLSVFSLLLLQHGIMRFVLVSLMVIGLGGLGVWLVARPASHVGASGLIYGYFAYVLVAGFLSREIKLILISIAAAIIYGGIIIGVLPSSPEVSWESHLFGFIAGVVAALLWARVIK